MNKINKIQICLCVTGVLSCLSLLSFLILTSFGVLAEESISSDVAVSVPTSCSMTGVVDSEHSASINPGTNQSDIGTTTLKVLCNDSEGFSIYAIGYGDNAYGNTNLTSANGNSSIATGTAISGNTSNWSMKIAKVSNPQLEGYATYNDANFTIQTDPNDNNSYLDYHTVPSSYTKIATYGASSDGTVGAWLQTTYQAYIQPAQRADTYSGKVKYTLVHPANAEAVIGYTVKFDPGSGSGVMPDQKIRLGTSTALNANAFTAPSGKGFYGWNTKADGTGTRYHDGEAVTDLAPADGSITLYAQWWSLDPVLLEIPFRQTVVASPSRVANTTFRYSVTPLDGAPAPNGSSGIGYYTFVGNTQGVIPLTLQIPFNFGRTYSYEIANATGRMNGWTLDTRTYVLDFTVVEDQNDCPESPITGGAPGCVLFQNGSWRFLNMRIYDHNERVYARVEFVQEYIEEVPSGN